MKKMKSTAGARDRLGELPDSLILKIFDFMPAKDVFRTPILSRRWKNLLTISPYLCFHGDNNELRRLVNRALSCWRGDRVRKFKVSGATLRDSLFPQLDAWLRFAVDNHVEVLEISFERVFLRGDDGYETEYCPPKCFYSCSSLQKLSLDHFKIEGNVQWSRLKSLKIGCLGVNQQQIDWVLCGSPLLEEFFLDFQIEDGNLELSFRSSSLKKLSICKGVCYHIRTNNTTLRIWTPNLVVLTVSGVPYSNCLLENVSSLARANLLFDRDRIRRETLDQAFGAIQHVEGLTLSEYCTEVVLEAMRSKSLLSPFSNVKFLSFSYHFKEHEKIVGLLEMFPMLKTLVVEDKAEYVDPMRKAKFRPNPSKSFLAELETVEVTLNGIDSFILPFIKIVLKFASKLEKMVFRVDPAIVSSDGFTKNMFLASKKLLKMPRSSPTAKLVFHDD